jgi:hypothetical protein
MPKFRVKRHAVTQPLDTSYKIIPLTKGQNTLVDTADYDMLNQWNWCAQWCEETQSFYAQKGGGVRIHQLILGCKWGDHKNHDTLDNRRENLRKCTRSQNARNARIRVDNKSGFKGVSWTERLNKWQVRIVVNRKSKYLGLFTSKEDAARAYDRAAEIYHGEFALKNFPS